MAVDVMGPLPCTDNQNEYIIVVCDYFSKYAEVYATSDHKAQTVADVIVTQFISRFGVPQQLHSDQGPEFESALFQEVCKLLEIDKTRTTPYRPQSDGLVERLNRTIQQMLAMFVNEHRNDWDDHLPYIMMAYRSSVQQSTGCTPNLLFFGREIPLPVDLMFGGPNEEAKCPVEYVEWVRQAMSDAYEMARENLGKSATRQEREYNRKTDARTYKVGDWVWRFYPPKAREKLGKGWTGPYLVIEKLSDVSYKIQLTEQAKPRVVHVDHLKRYETDSYPHNWLVGVDDTLDQSMQGVEPVEVNEPDRLENEFQGPDPEVRGPGTPEIAGNTAQTDDLDVPIAMRRGRRMIKPRDILDL
jgi:transposase InsO family protein